MDWVIVCVRCAVEVVDGAVLVMVVDAFVVIADENCDDDVQSGE